MGFLSLSDDFLLLTKTAAITSMPMRLTVATADRTESVVARSTVCDSNVVGLLVLLLGSNTSLEAAVADGSRGNSGIMVSEPVLGSQVCVMSSHRG